MNKKARSKVNSANAKKRWEKVNAITRSLIMKQVQQGRKCACGLHWGHIGKHNAVEV